MRRVAAHLFSVMLSMVLLDARRIALVHDGSTHAGVKGYGSMSYGYGNSTMEAMPPEMLCCFLKRHFDINNSITE